MQLVCPLLLLQGHAHKHKTSTVALYNMVYENIFSLVSIIEVIYFTPPITIYIHSHQSKVLFTLLSEASFRASISSSVTPQWKFADPIILVSVI